ncbi:MAG: ribosome silencing factor [Pseudomonadota bacterium]
MVEFKTPRELALAVVEAALVKNALEPVLLDVAKDCSYADYILVLSGRNTRQVEAIAEAIQKGMKERGYDPLSREGDRRGQWVLLDFNEVVVHIFYHPMREYYDLEGLWSEAKRVELDVPPELRHAAIYA